MHTSLSQLCEALEHALPEERAANACALALATYRRLPGGDLSRLDTDLAVRRISRALDAFEEGTADDPTIRVEAVDGTTLVHIHLTDGPFVLSTITEELHRLGLEPLDLAHPVVGVVRDADGALREITSARDADHRETYLALDLQTELGERSRTRVAEHLHRVLADALHVVGDFHDIRSAVERIIDEASGWGDAAAPFDGDPDELVAFLRWLLDDHFVFLGYRRYDVRDDAVTVGEGSGLGLLRDEGESRFADPVKVADLSGVMRAHVAAGGPLLRMTRTARSSTVHRQVRMMDIGVPRLDGDGAVVGRHRLIGLLAQKAFVEPASKIPVLRRKLGAILDAEDVVDHSQDERALRTLFDAFPKQELFESDTEHLRDSLVSLMDLGRHGDVRVMLRPEESGHSTSALVTVPRERFSSELREDIQQLIAERVGAQSVSYQLSMTERDQPLMHFTMRLREGESARPVDVDALQQEIVVLTRSFADTLVDALAGDGGPVGDRAAARRWADALPATYTQTTAVETAVEDVRQLVSLDGPEAVRMRLAAPAADDDADLLRFRLSKAGEGVELSGFVPVLESLGLVVVEEHPYELRDTPVADEVHLHDYGVRCETAVDVDADGPRIAAAAHAMWEQRAQVDSLNRLVTSAGMDVGEVVVLRAYRRYLRQIGTTYTEATTNEALLEHPDVARALIAYVDARFDPDGPADPEAREAAASDARQAVVDALDQVTRLDQDRILRSFLGVIDATLRTNRWRDRPWLALKVDPSRVPGVPKPVPFREVFVYSPRMEGVHLRGGPVARGGLRWSDRMDDFRTEVLGLMKAQVAKNAVIVPTGSKGGFVLKQRPTDSAQLAEEVEAQYRVFIRGLLDVTDDIEGDRIVAPDRVVRADGDDPYLVVAPDKGTAAFSDVANAISEEYGYWLGDAFASGGSSGYDHKSMGITARGAWVAVQRHFRELGVDVQTEPFTAVGVGDMSGDVFGNGMLRSRTTRLVAAFDHRDIFIDPAPDPGPAYDERRRLYETPRSSWQDYDRDLISPGGGVWSRTAKVVPLSPEAREALRVDAEELSPPELIRAILAAPADLLWFGGIGTYVKAREESHADVGDRANDAVRIDADEIGARVVGEGGNLAMTQRGRIAYSRRGGRCNTDAIDNVAGVNTSDREVNLKILLGQAIEDGLLDEADRDDLLASQTEELADQVLRDSYLQTWAVSQELHAAPGGMGGYEMLMSRLESRGRLDRDVEVLPDPAEIDRRQDQGAGMTRPELCVLLAYAKIDLSEALLASDVIDQPEFDEVRTRYFPTPVAERFGDLPERHRLGRELVATVVANDLCNRLGITWATRTAGDLGCDVAEVAGAYWLAREVIDADGLWREVEGLDARTDPVLQLELKERVDWLVDAFARSYVRMGRVADISAAVADDRPLFRDLAERTAKADLREQRRSIREAAERWIDLGIDEEVATRMAALPALMLVPGIAVTARSAHRSVADCAAVYEGLARHLPLEQLNAGLMAYEPHGRWQRGQHRGLIDDLRGIHHTLARQAIAEDAGTGDDADPAEVVERYLAAREDAVAQAGDIARQVRSQTDSDLDALAVAVRALGQIIA